MQSIGNRFNWTKNRVNFDRLGLPKINSYNRNCNPNRKIFMKITHLCLIPSKKMINKKGDRCFCTIHIYSEKRLKCSDPFIDNKNDINFVNYS